MPNPETRSCESCSTEFTILPKDFELYEKLKVNPPKLCPRCGIRWAMSLRNERNVYQRACDKCGKSGLSMYHKDAPYVVYCHECWWKDDWSGKDYAMDYDPSRPVMDQFLELQKKVPREALINVNTINCDYGNMVRDSKDIYFCFQVDHTENALYSIWLTGNSRDLLGSRKIISGERIVSSVDIVKCSNSAYLQDCADSVDCYFSYDLKGCNNCLFSSNLRNKTNYVRNVQITPEEFQAEKARVLNGSWATLQGSIAEYELLKNSAVRRFANIVKCNDVVGNYLDSSSSLRFCFETVNIEQCHAVISILNAKEVAYSYSIGIQPGEYMFGCSVIKGGSNLRFCFNLLTSSDCVLCDSLLSSSNCIASVGLKHAEYSILNKQYEKDEYVKIQDELFAKGELSDFPPATFSAFAFNESAANDYYPLDEAGAISQGYRWQHDTTKTTGKETLQPENVPDTIHDVDESILKEILRCTKCNRNYRIVKAELDLLRSFPLPLPRECPQCHMDKNRLMRRPFELYHRSCMKPGCTNEFETSYTPDRPEIIYCESCYQAEVA